MINYAVHFVEQNNPVRQLYILICSDLSYFVSYRQNTFDGKMKFIRGKKIISVDFYTCIAQMHERCNRFGRLNPEDVLHPHYIDTIGEFGPPDTQFSPHFLSSQKLKEILYYSVLIED